MRRGRRGAWRDAWRRERGMMVTLIALTLLGWLGTGFMLYLVFGGR